jgi:peptidoglycan/xylan/chitin deacetylase (PgdA/CDA1 family)
MDSTSTPGAADRDALLDLTPLAVPHGPEARYYLEEKYRAGQDRGRLLDLYYQVRPLMPRSIQLALRRGYSRIQRKQPFPAWPVEPILVDLANQELTRILEARPGLSFPMVSYWPAGKEAAIVLTHDVETAVGVANIVRVREVERKYGLVSSWNFVPERYWFDHVLLREITDEGCELGVHGLYHDGRLFSSLEVFNERRPHINRYLRDWGSVGFRSPALHRRVEWLPLIEAEYDSSFPDTDPFEPQPGGCCSIFPFELGRMIELPVTMPQDHTLFEILGQKDISVWKQKAEWIISNHGMVLVLVHPDYMVKPENLARYEELLAYLAGRSDCWYALPRDVARWWRKRLGSGVSIGRNGVAHIEGPAAGIGEVEWLSPKSGRVFISQMR